jgi:hypothetical protein
VILAAGTLVLLGLAMFVAGLATGATAFFWGCVAVCVVAAALLVLARRHMAATREAAPDERAAVPATAVVAAATSEPAAAGPRRRRAPPESVRRTAELPVVPPPARAAAEEPATAVAPALESWGPESDGREFDSPESAGPETAVAEPPDYDLPVHESTYYQRLSAGEPPDPTPPPSGATAFSAAQAPTSGAIPAVGAEEPPMEDVEVTDLLLIVDLKDEVLVIDEHPRYHLAGCPYVASQETIPLPLDEARADGFTPCGICSPDQTLAERERTRRHSSGGRPGP